VVFLYSGLWYLTSGIRELSSATKKAEGGGGDFFYFAGFQKMIKKRLVTFWTIPVDFYALFVENDCIYEFLSEKQPLL
jgi:hypothetical protein